MEYSGCHRRHHRSPKSRFGPFLPSASMYRQAYPLPPVTSSSSSMLPCSLGSSSSVITSTSTVCHWPALEVPQCKANHNDWGHRWLQSQGGFECLAMLSGKLPTWFTNATSVTSPVIGRMALFRIGAQFRQGPIQKSGSPNLAPSTEGVL